MSATGRSERGGGGSDFFPTPAWCVDWLLRAVHLPAGNWLEPSAGDGAIIRAVNARRDGVSWFAIEIREECRDALDNLTDGETMIADFPKTPWSHEGPFYDVVIGNPPYTDAAAHIARALDCGRVVAFLLRLNFLGSQKRLDFWRRHPADVYVLSERPSFDGEGTDATEYAWFVWGQCAGRAPLVRVLGPDDGQQPLFTEEIR